jgi:hypothetical protein
MFAASKSARATGAAPTPDPSFAYVPLLLNTTSTNGQQNNTFLDSSTNNFTITRNSTPTQGSITPYWPAGQWSNYFSSSYLSVADSASLRFGAANFTIEAWVFRTASGATHTIAAKGAATPTGWVFQISSADKLVFIDTSTSITGATSLAANTWYYVAVVRAGTGSNQTTLYVNGTSDGTGTSATTFSQTDAMRIGTDRSAANGFVGYVSNLRLSNTNLTISSTPTTPLTALGSTIFLSCGYNRFVDGSSLGSAITVGSGTPRVQAFQPFSPTASYTTALYGGSGYFNGSTDYLTSTITAPNSSIVSFECWVYNLGLDGTQGNHYITIGTTNWTFSHNPTGSARFFCRNDAGTTIFDITSASGVLKLNQWQYMVGIRSGSNAALYVDGVRVGTATGLGAVTATQTTLYVSSNQGSVRYTNGYLSNVRIQSGTLPSGYDPTSTTIAVPTTPLAAVTGTLFLGNFTNSGIYDAAVQNNVITVGDAQASTTITAQWPPTSMKFDGTGDWLTAIDNPQLQLGTGDFTIEGWFYLTANGTAYGIVSKGAASTGWSVNVTSGNRIQFSYTAANLTGATTTLAASTWYYFAVVRSGSATGNLKIYINGTLEVTSGGAVTDNFNQTNILYVGASRTGTTPLNGYLEDIRITKAARTITESPTAAFPTR